MRALESVVGRHEVARRGWEGGGEEVRGGVEVAEAGGEGEGVFHCEVGRKGFPQRWEEEEDA